MIHIVFVRILAFLRVLYCMACTLVRDVKGIRMLLKIKKYLRQLDEQKKCVPDIFESWYHKQPNKPCIVFQDKTWTFKDMEVYANKITNAFADKYKLKKGDAICLFMDNKPEYVGIWLGLSKLGVISALLNTNLRTTSLVHCIKVAKPKLLIYGEEQEQQVLEVRETLKREIDSINFIRQGNSALGPDESQQTVQLEALLKPSSDVFERVEPVYGSDVLMYIYTSGTTGLPKPAIIKHNRYIAGGYSFFTSSGLNKNEVFFVTLPIYHSNAGCIGIGAALISGCTVVLRKKFSATTFWKDCIQYKCTAFSYVGEVCRYLLNQPPSEYDKKHQVRVCVGNGLRASIHREFSERFNIKAVEVYGATEGNCTLVNMDGKYGACGFLPILGRYIPLAPVYCIKVDNKMNPIRDANGSCIVCEPNEKGLLVGIIGKDTRQDYSGYANSSESTNSKIIHDLFKKGQRAFNTGDMVMVDDFGWVYFVDRLGDTFRWRGENVSTIEVENIVSSKINSIETVVYGVEVPGQEGRAGMATIMSNSVDIKKLGESLKKDLPAYARPLFIRLNEHVEHTGSFKAQKSKLVEEAFNVEKYKDKTFYFDVREQNYLELTPEVYQQIVTGKLKV